jgi:hypothetical protein
LAAEINPTKQAISGVKTSVSLRSPVLRRVLAGAANARHRAGRRTGLVIVFLRPTWYNAARLTLVCDDWVATNKEATVAKREVLYTYQLDRTLYTLSHGGLLLAATRGDGRSNAMVS